MSAAQITSQINTFDDKPRRGKRGYHKSKDGLLNVKPIGSEIAIVQRNAKESPLLRLPAEIRSIIWKLAIGNPIIRPAWGGPIKPLRYRSVFEERASEFPAPRHRFALLRVCRQIYSEAAAYSRQISVFRFYNFGSLQYWLNHATSAQRKAVQKVQFGRYEYILRRWMSRNFAKELKKLPGLTQVEISYYGYNAEATKELLDGLDKMKGKLGKTMNVKLEYQARQGSHDWVWTFLHGEDFNV
ncbi:hypothetical protein J4E83_007584 [Alternaria metachromatica]|uniref:uncharacterized protein n=1 Tax=Alternaria metachromatica TaxID=283354 RepID=UPI0020C41DC4|nr:uncharacterized protein J4E83_007584 [Alternaria metachromatica]KAI4613172.1 hypothetical protein J4E83_007584 [Alternaria metachromatica]